MVEELYGEKAREGINNQPLKAFCIGSVTLVRIGNSETCKANIPLEIFTLVEKFWPNLDSLPHAN